MSYFLAKTEPASYSIDDLQRDGKTVWDGVKNPQALRALREMKPGDRVFIYHTGGVSSIVGLAEVTGARNSTGEGDPAVEIRYFCHLEPPTTLAEIKEDGQFGDWSLVRQGRLSTMAAPDGFVKWMRGRYSSVKL